MHGGGTGLVAALAKAGESQAAGAVDDQASGEFADAGLLAQVDFAIAENVVEKRPDVFAPRFPLAHFVAHVAEDQSARRGRKDIVRELRVRRVGRTRKTDHRQAGR